MNASLIPWNGHCRSVREAQDVAAAMAASGYFHDAKEAAKAFVKILAGAELGVGPFTAMNNVYIVDGRPMPGAHLFAAMILRHHRYRIIQCDRTRCEIEFFRRQPDNSFESQGCISMDMEQAKKDGLLVSRSGKVMPNWQFHSDDMLFARVISKGYKRYYPDLSAYVPEITEEEEPEVTVTSVTTNGTTQEEEAPNPLFEYYNRIDMLQELAKITPEQMERRLLRDGSRSLANLTEEQLKKLESELQTIVNKRQTQVTT